MESGWQDNQTLEDCLEENFGETIIDCSRCFNLQERPQWQLYIHALVMTAIILATVIGNGLVILLIIKYKVLRHRTALVSLSIILANTILVLSYHIPVLISTLSMGWLFAFVGCQVFGFLSTDFIITRWLIMGVLALDRFCAVRFPFSYQRHNKWVMTILLCASWIIPTLLCIVTVDGYSAVTFRPNVPTCLLYAPTVGRGKLYFSIVLTFSFLVGGILPTVMYVWLFHKARKLRKSMLNVGKINNSKESIISVQDMQSNSSNERRAAFTFALIFVAFCLTTLPIILFQMIRSLSLALWCEIPHMVHFTVVQLFLSSTALDPFLVMRDRDFRKRLKHLLCCHNNCGKYYTNRSNIHPEIPPNRDFDAVRSMATRALNLVSLPSLRDANNNSNPNSLLPPPRPRSGSAPAVYFGRMLRPSSALKLPDTIEEMDREEEEMPGGQEAGENTFSTGLGSEPAEQEEVQVEVHEEFKHEIIYSNRNNKECIQVSISFED